jgi:replication initiation and membrane attachment protein DnaB
MEKRWVRVHSTSNYYHAEMIRQMLSDNGIDAFIINKKDSSYLFGEVEIYTLPDYVMKSKLLIEKFEH